METTAEGDKSRGGEKQEKITEEEKHTHLKILIEEHWRRRQLREMEKATEKQKSDDTKAGVDVQREEEISTTRGTMNVEKVELGKEEIRKKIEAVLIKKVTTTISNKAPGKMEKEQVKETPARQAVTSVKLSPPKKYEEVSSGAVEVQQEKTEEKEDDSETRRRRNVRQIIEEEKKRMEQIEQERRQVIEAGEEKYRRLQEMMKNSVPYQVNIQSFSCFFFFVVLFFIFCS